MLQSPKIARIAIDTCTTDGVILRATLLPIIPRSICLQSPALVGRYTQRFPCKDETSYVRTQWLKTCLLFSKKTILLKTYPQ